MDLELTLRRRLVEQTHHLFIVCRRKDQLILIIQLDLVWSARARCETWLSVEKADHGSDLPFAAIGLYSIANPEAKPDAVTLIKAQGWRDDCVAVL